MEDKLARIPRYGTVLHIVHLPDVPSVLLHTASIVMCCVVPIDPALIWCSLIGVFKVILSEVKHVL